MAIAGLFFFRVIIHHSLDAGSDRSSAWPSMRVLDSMIANRSVRDLDLPPALDPGTPEYFSALRVKMRQAQVMNAYMITNIVIDESPTNTMAVEWFEAFLDDIKGTVFNFRYILPKLNSWAQEIESDEPEVSKRIRKVAKFLDKRSMGRGL